MMCTPPHSNILMLSPIGCPPKRKPKQPTYAKFPAQLSRTTERLQTDYYAGRQSRSSTLLDPLGPEFQRTFNDVLRRARKGCLFRPCKLPVAVPWVYRGCTVGGLCAESGLCPRLCASIVMATVTVPGPIFIVLIDLLYETRKWPVGHMEPGLSCFYTPAYGPCYRWVGRGERRINILLCYEDLTRRHSAVESVNPRALGIAVGWSRMCRMPG
jgi:hypothetical protein